MGGEVRSPAVKRVHAAQEALRAKYAGSAAEHLMHRLGAMDVINRGMMFAAVLLLCLFPFMIVLDALSGRSAVTQFSRRLGLNQQAATDVGHLFGPASSTTAAVTGASYVFFILAGIAAATALQGLYEAAFDVAPRGIKDTPRRFVWLGVLVGASLLASWVGPHLRSSAGPVALGVVGLIGLTLFWWLTMWILVGGRVSWRELFPCAVATGVFWLGMEIVFSFTFSGIVTSDQQKYGAIGVVFGLMSWLIAIGVVVILGAVVGVMWRERHSSRAAPLRPKDVASSPPDLESTAPTGPPAG
jgi:membrane protein